MIMKSNLGKMLGRMAPQQGAGVSVQPQQPQLGGGLMSLLNQPNPPGGVTSSDMIGTLGRMLGGRRPMRPTNTGNGELVMPAIPQPYQEGPDGGMPPVADKGFDPVAWMNQPYTPVSPQPRALTPEEGMQGLSGFMSRFGNLLNKGPGRGVGYRAFDEGVGGGMPSANAEAGIPLWMQLAPGPERDAAYAAAQGGSSTSVMPATGTRMPEPPRYMPPPMEIGYPIKTDQRFEPSPSTPPPSFDRNAALQAFNARAGRSNAMFTNGLFGSGGVSPDEFRSYQTKLRDLQLNTGSTPEQHDAALREAMSYMDRVAPLPVERPPVIVERQPEIPQGMGQVSGVGNAAPAFDPNRALQELNAQLGRIHKGGGQLDMNFVRDQQARLRDLQVNRDATPEQHDAAYRNAMAELRARYPDAFAG